jgi:hypothetical protein
MLRNLARYLLYCAPAFAMFVPLDDAQAKSYQMLHSFNNNVGGLNPVAGMIMDQNGNLYGTTAGTRFNGGDGTVFVLASGSRKPKFLHTFEGGGDRRQRALCRRDYGQGGQHLRHDSWRRR